MRFILSLLALLLTLASCNTSSPETHQTTPPEAGAPSLVSPAPIFPVMDSTCDGPSEHYPFDLTISVKDNTLGYARVRSNSNYFHPGYEDNLLGTVPCGAVMHAFLPEHFRDTLPSTRNPYYVVKVLDQSGDTCVGYIAGHVVGEMP